MRCGRPCQISAAIDARILDRSERLLVKASLPNLSYAVLARREDARHSRRASLPRRRSSSWHPSLGPCDTHERRLLGRIPCRDARTGQPKEKPCQASRAFLFKSRTDPACVRLSLPTRREKCFFASCTVSVALAAGSNSLDTTHCRGFATEERSLAVWG